MNTKLSTKQKLIQRWQTRIIEWFTVSSDAWLKRLIKLCAVGLTTPATVIVAGELYPNQGLLTLMIQICALGLCEGTMLLGWDKLNASNDKQATTQQRWLYAALALVGYGVLWAVALAHNEGLIGIAFRLTLGVLLVYSVFEAGLLANVRLQRSAEKDVAKDRKVRNTKHKTEVDLALRQIESNKRIESLRIQIAEKNAIQAIQPNYYSNNRSGVLRWLFGDTNQPQKSLNSSTAARNANRAQIENENIVLINARRMTEKTQRRAETSAHWQANPDNNESEIVAWSKSTFGVSESTARNDLKALRSDSVISTNGAHRA